MSGRPIGPSALLLLGMIILCLAVTGPAFGETPPVWWDRAREEAGERGYALITPKELKAFIKGDEDFLLLDVRPDYEFESGHIPQALNFEFHLGDRLQIGQEKQAALQKLLGPDKDRRVVIYCRSFR